MAFQLPKFDVAYSPNAQLLLERAVVEAVSRNHDVLCTEHVTVALLSTTNRAILWIARASFPDESENPIAKLREKLVAWMEERQIFRPRATPITGQLVVSETLHSALEIAAQIGRGPVRDGESVLQNGIIATEFIVAGLLLEGTGIGSAALTRCSQGRVNSLKLLHALHVDPAKIIRRSLAEEGHWREFTLQSSTPVAPRLPQAWFPGSFAAIAPIPTSPTESSNWLIPNRLIIGEHPHHTDVATLVNSGVTTFVSLIGEYDVNIYKTRKYPSAVPTLPQALVDFIHFPINDFDVPSAHALKLLVDELVRRMLAGAVVFIHCRGGHGRSGTVVIPLVVALYDIEEEQARDYILQQTRTHRASDRGHHIDMPETEEQWAVITAIQDEVKHRIAARK